MDGWTVGYMIGGWMDGRLESMKVWRVGWLVGRMVGQHGWRAENLEDSHLMDGWMYSCIGWNGWIAGLLEGRIIVSFDG